MHFQAFFYFENCLAFAIYRFLVVVGEKGRARCCYVVLSAAVAMHFFFIEFYLCCLLTYDYSFSDAFILQLLICSADAMIIWQ